MIGVRFKWTAFSVDIKRECQSSQINNALKIILKDVLSFVFLAQRPNSTKFNL